MVMPKMMKRKEYIYYLYLYLVELIDTYSVLQNRAAGAAVA
jgi:hypothetical protein